jgi:hypothetical protein
MSNSEKARNKSRSQTLFVIINLFLTVINVWAAVQTLAIRNETLRLQELTSDYPPTMVVNPDFGYLGAPSLLSRSGDTVQTWHYGYMRIDLDVIVPHYGNVSIRLMGFTVGDSELLDYEKLNETEVSYVDEGSTYVVIVEPGVNHVVTNLHLMASIYPEPDKIPTRDQPRSLILGELQFEVELFDLQSKATILRKESSSKVVVVISEL